VPKRSYPTEAPDQVEISRRGEPRAGVLQSSGPAIRRDPSAPALLTIRPFAVLASVWLAAAAVAAVVRAAMPFAHGIWLIAYLFLVGSLAQVLLGTGQSSLWRRAGKTSSAARVVRAEAILWNVGVLAVPFGVLVNARIAVVIGSCSVLPALALFARSLNPSPKPHGAISIAMAYTVLLLGMAVSVVIGTALAWDIPWR
jgi:hypothetical protein